MEDQHYRTNNDENDVDDEEFPINNINVLEKSTDEGLETRQNMQQINKIFSFLYVLDDHELSITPIPEAINDEDINVDTIEPSKSQVNI